MDFSITYRNNKGESINFGGDDNSFHYFDNEIRNAQWRYENSNNQVLFFKDPIELSFPVGIEAETEEEGLTLRNELIRIAEYDIAINKPGKLIIGDYYLNCWVSSRSYANYYFSDALFECTMSILTLNPFWIREHVYKFYRTEESNENSEFLHYPYNYPYNYRNSTYQRGFIENESSFPSDFLLRIAGPANNPSVVIGQNTYQVNAVVPSDGRLEIDSEEGSVILIEQYGQQQNAFNYRLTGGEGSGTYIFEKIPSGNNNIGSDYSFDYDLTIKERYSEPYWR